MIASNTFNTTKEVWFVTGSQHLYGPKVLATVAQDSEIIVAGLNQQAGLPVKLVCKPTVKSPEEIFAVCQQANASLIHGHIGFIKHPELGIKDFQPFCYNMAIGEEP